jgi:hypothetical protein
LVARKQSNLKRSQDEHERRRKGFVIDALVTLHGRGARFPTVTDLSKQVADMVTLKERTCGSGDRPCANTTLLRSRRDGSPSPYRLLLESYMDGTFAPEKPEGKLTSKDIEAFIKKYPALRGYIAQKDLTISNLKAELRAKEQSLVEVKSYLQTLPSDAPQLTDAAGQLKRDELRQAKDDLAKTCTWIRRFIDDFDWLEIDEEVEEIRNLAKRGKPIADKSLLVPFFRCIKTSIPRGGDDE